ncbi:MAG: TIGR04076 family protein [Eubacteriales bacterium]
MNRGTRPKIKITITDRRGKMGCHRGHKVGDSFDFDTQRGEICPMAMHCGFPYIDILRYGGRLPGQKTGMAEFCCSDADVIMVFRAEIVNELEK